MIYFWSLKSTESAQSKKISTVPEKLPYLKIQLLNGSYVNDLRFNLSKIKNVSNLLLLIFQSVFNLMFSNSLWI